MVRRNLNVQNAGRFILGLPAERLDGLFEVCKQKMEQLGIAASGRATRNVKLAADGRVTGNLASIIAWVRDFDPADYGKDEKDGAVRDLQTVHACCLSRLRQAGRDV